MVDTTSFGIDLVRPCLLVYIIAVLPVLVVLFLHKYGWYLTYIEHVCLKIDHRVRKIQNSEKFCAGFASDFAVCSGAEKAGCTLPASSGRVEDSPAVAAAPPPAGIPRPKAVFKERFGVYDPFLQQTLTSPYLIVDSKVQIS
jgi:hypothetical protein